MTTLYGWFLNKMAKKKKVTEEITEIAEEIVDEEVKLYAGDRSAYNCQPCTGLGLLENGNICSTCKGTGKV